MSLLRRDDFFKSSFDDPFFESWDSDLKDFRQGFFKNSLLAASPAVAITGTVDQGAAPRALRRQKSWYDRELESASQDGDFSVSKSFAKREAGADVSGSLKAERKTDESADGRDKAQYEKSEREMTAAAVSADGKSSSIAAEKSSAESAKKSSNYVSPDGSCAMSGASSSTSSSSASKSESASTSGDLAAIGVRSKMAAASSSSSSSKSASFFSSSSSASSSSAFKNSSMLDGTDISSLTTGMSALPRLTGMLEMPEMPGLKAMPALRGMSPMSATSSALSSSSKSSLSSKKESASAISSKSAVKSSLAKESLTDVSIGSTSKFLAGDSAPPSRAPPSYAESIVDEEEDCKVYYPISYKALQSSPGVKTSMEVGRQDSIPVSQSFFTIIDGNTRKLKLQFYVGRGYDAKSVQVTSEGRKLMVRCCQGAMVFSKDVNLPEEIDASLISSLLSKDGVLTVQCILSDKTVSGSTLQGPIVKDEEGNKVIQLRYDVQAFDPKDVKVVLQGDMLRIRAVREEHSASVCIKKEFKRDFALPAEADKESLVYKIEEGILAVKVNVKEQIYQRALSEEGCVGNKIHLEFDVADFEPEDIEVKLEGGTLSVGGRRRAKFEKEAQVLDFTRECVVPAWVDSDSLRSYLTPAGKLTIEIPMEKTVRSELHFNVNQ